MKNKTITEEKTLLGETGYLVGGVAVLLAIFLWLGSNDIAIEWIFYGAISALGLFCYLILSWSLNPKELEDEVSKDLEKGELGEFYLVGLPCLLFSAFTVTSYFGWKLHGDAFISVQEGTHPIQFVFYGFDNIIRALCLDVCEVYRLKISNIEHANGFLPSTFVFVFRSTLSIALISVVFRSAKMIWKRKS